MATPPGVVRFDQIIKRLVDRLGPQAAQDWIQLVFKTQKRINLTALRAALTRKDVAAAARVLHVADLQKSLQTMMAKRLLAAAQAGGEGGTIVLRAKGLEVSFDAVDPRVVKAAREQAATLVQGISTETRTIIREITAMGATGLSVAEQARAIREVVGLPANWALAPQRLIDDIIAGRRSATTRTLLSSAERSRILRRIDAGTNSAAFAQDLGAKYAQRLIKHRALRIARQETSAAAHEGLSQGWAQAVEQGALPKTVRRYWIITPDERLCKICRRIPGMNPQGRKLNESFMTPEGPVKNPPAPHPHCRCSVGLMLTKQHGLMT